MARLDAGAVKTRAGAPSVQPPKTSLKDMKQGKPGVPESLKGVLFGPPKTGKTTLAASGGSTLLINFDPEGYATKSLQGRKDIDILQPQNLMETDAILQALIAGESDHDWIVLDSVTFMFQRFGGREILQTYTAGKDIRRAYGQAGAAAGQIINDLAFLRGRNVLFVAHLAREDGDDEAVAVDQSLGEHEVRLAVTPMVWKILGPAVGFIGRTYKETVREAGTGNTETLYYVSYNDGSRSPAGSRYDMEGLYEASDTFLSDLTAKLL
jgi:hypothetical protein